MIIGYSEKTLWRNINRQYEEIDSELQWLNHYIAIGEVKSACGTSQTVAPQLWRTSNI